MSNPRITPDEMLCLFVLGACWSFACLSLVLAACAGFWIAAEASLVAVVVLVAEAGYLGRCILERGRVEPLLNSTKAAAGEEPR